MSNPHRKTFNGLAFIGIGFLLTAFGFTLMFLRDYISPFLSVVVCNTSIIIGVIFTYRGLFDFYDKKSYPIIYDIVGSVLFFVLFVYYLEFEPNVNMRIIIICCYLIVYYLLSLYAVLYKPVHDTKMANWFTASILIVASSFYIYRLMYTLNADFLYSFMDAGMIHTLAILIFALWSVMICFGVFIVMNNVSGEELARNVYFDSLTRVYNRRALVDAPFVKRSDCENAAYIICDVDHFKAFNDKYGHVFGDQILVKIADVMTGSTRESDVIVRYGGDEFFLYISCQNLDQINVVCKKLKKNIQNLSLEYEGELVSVTMSFGVYFTKDRGIDCKECLVQADQALYQAKNEGRNKIVLLSD